MSKFYTDQEMHWGAQLGYYNFTSRDIEKNGENPTIQELLIKKMNNPDYNLLELYCHHKTDYILYAEDITGHTADIIEFTKAQYNALDYKIRHPEEYSVEDIKSSVDFYAFSLEDKFTLSLLFNMDFVSGTLDEFPPSQWKLVDVENQNNGNGFFALTVIPKEENNQANALVCYRGSEREGSFCTLASQLLTDWELADVGLATGVATEQEISAGKYLTQILKQEYATVATTGHSLGGNLANVAPLLVDDDELLNKFVEGCSFDGPGNPNDFKNLYLNRINLVKDRLYHYAYTLVGGFYDYDSIAGHSGEIELTKDNSGWIANHFLSYVKFDKDGMVKWDLSAGDKFNCVDITRAITYFSDLNEWVDGTVADFINTCLVEPFKKYVAFSEAWYDRKNGGSLGKVITTGAELLASLAYAGLDALSLGLPSKIHTAIEQISHVNSLEDILDVMLFGISTRLVASNRTLGDHLKDGRLFNKNNTDIDDLSKELNTLYNGEYYYNYYYTHLDEFTSKKYKESIGFVPYRVEALGDIHSIDYERKVIHNELSKAEEDYDTSFRVVRYNPDPLVLDFDGDGLEILSLTDGVYFDEDNKGLKERTQWIGANDALLALDLNKDGIITNGSELFGTSTILSDGSIARNGFEALSQYDSNNDGIIDENDEIFSNLLVWQDKNSDGITDEGEVISAKDMGIKSISLERNEDDERTSVVTFEDGRTIRMSEVDFEARYYDSMEYDIEISDEIKGLPNVMAIGNIASLHALMQLDESGELKEKVLEFIETTDKDHKEELLTEILYKVCKAESIESGSRGGEFDAKKLKVIEEFLGEDFFGTAGANPVNTAAPILEGIYDKIFNIYYSLLAKEGELKSYLDYVFVYEGEEGERYFDTSFMDMLVKYDIESGKDMSNIVSEMSQYIHVFNGENNINLIDYIQGYAEYEGYLEKIGKQKLGITIGTSGDDSISLNDTNINTIAGLGDDIVYGNNANNTIYGNSGDDRLYGNNGNDTLIGGTGNDYLDGGVGNDTYIFNLGDGVDKIYDLEASKDNGRADKIIFGEGISANDVKMERKGNNLEIEYSEEDKIVIENAYSGYVYDGVYEIENIEFADGTKAVVDYANEGLEITYIPEITDIVESINEVISDSDISEEDLADENSQSAVYGEYDVNTMTDLMIQELAGASESGVSENIIQNNENSSSDTLLWTA